MPAFHLDAAVTTAFPDTLIALVTATGLRGHEPCVGLPSAGSPSPSHPAATESPGRMSPGQSLGSGR